MIKISSWLLSLLVVNLALSAQLGYGEDPNFLKPIEEVRAKSSCRIEIKYYSIRGSTAADLRKAMNRLGPSSTDGKRRDATTSWHIKWKWPLSQGQPDFRQTQTSCYILLTLPRWEIPADAEPGLKEKWADFMLSLAKHEAQHLRHASQNHPLIGKRIIEAAAKNQSLSADQANGIGQSVLSEIFKLDSNYDQLTHNGQTEGTPFP